MKNTKYLAAGLLGLAFLCWPCPGIHAAESRHLAQMSHDPGGFEELTWNETLPSMQKKFVLEYLGKEAAGQHYAAILPNKKNELYKRPHCSGTHLLQSEIKGCHNLYVRTVHSPL